MSRFVCGRWGASNNGLLSRGWFRSLLSLIKTDRELIEPCGPWERVQSIRIWPRHASDHPRGAINILRCTACGQERAERLEASR